jgi:hypothetical protein
MRLAFAIVIIFIARFAVGAWFDPVRDGDIAWQQWLGHQILQTGHLPLTLGSEAFTAAGAPWVPQEWALSVIVALTVGTPWFALLVALTAAAAATTLLLTAWTAKRLGASTAAIGLCTLFTAFSMVESSGIRAQVFAWAAISAVMFVLRTSTGASRWWIVPITALWANVHASAALAPALLMLWTIGIAIEERGWNARVRAYAFLTLACGAAVFLTPLGYRLPLYAVELVQSPIRYAIQEWQPAYLSAASFGMGSLALIAATCVFGIRRQQRWSEFLVFAALTWMSFSALRNVPICGIVLAPAVAQRLTAYLPNRLRVNTIFAERPVLAVLYATTLCTALLIFVTLAGSTKFTESRIPSKAIAMLAAQSGTHQLLCEDFAWCSAALAYGNVREFIDGRCDPFPLPVWNDYEKVAGAKPGWQDVLHRRNVDAVVAKTSSKLGRALVRLHAWRQIYSDRHYRLFIRESAVAETD